jgi:site-specific recombinase XerC
LRFLYKVSLKKNWSFGDVIPAPKKPQKLPVVLSPEEVLHFLSCVASSKHRAILTTCYASGLRISEVICLKPTDIDSQRMVIRVEQGKGQKDRYVMSCCRPSCWKSFGLSTMRRRSVRRPVFTGIRSVSVVRASRSAQAIFKRRDRTVVVDARHARRS